MKQLIIVLLVVAAALGATACETTFNGQPYDCLWTPNGLVCAPIYVQPTPSQ
jgi:hypothetical protein